MEEETFFEQAYNAAQEEVDPYEDVLEVVKRDVTNLIHLGKLEDSFELYDHQFTIRTLNMAEELEVEQLLIQEFSSNFNEKGWKTAIIAAALSSQDGRPLVSPLSPGEATLPRAYQKVKRWYRPVIDALYEHYSALEERQRQVLDELGKAPASLSTSEDLSDSLTPKDSSLDTS
jgi:hypothetical protein